jgi:hypothetical protein
MESPSAEKGKSPRSPLLDHVRSTQTQAMEQRTATRIRTLMETEKRNDELRGTYQSSSQRLQGSSSPLLTGRSPMMSGSVVRRNITQRKSRGRSRDDGSTAPDASLLARRPRSRSKDRRYSLESNGTLMNRSDSNIVVSDDNDAPFVTAISAPSPPLWEDRARRSPDKRETVFGDSSAFEAHETYRHHRAPPSFSDRSHYDATTVPLVTAIPASNPPLGEDRSQISPDKRANAFGESSRPELFGENYRQVILQATASFPESLQPEPVLFRELTQGVKPPENWQELAMTRDPQLKMGSEDPGISRGNDAVFTSGYPDSSRRNDAVFTAIRMHPSFNPAKNNGDDGSYGDHYGDNGSSSGIGSVADEWEDEIFSKKSIPPKNTHPELHEKLFKLWGYRQSVSTAMSLALDDDDMRQYDTVSSPI